MKQRDFIKRSSLGDVTAWAASSLMLNACHTQEHMIGEPSWIVEGSLDRLLTQPPNSSTGAVLNAHFSMQYTGVFAFHCHNLEHEDDGMILNYRIQ